MASRHSLSFSLPCTLVDLIGVLSRSARGVAGGTGDEWTILAADCQDLGISLSFFISSVMLAIESFCREKVRRNLALKIVRGNDSTTYLETNDSGLVSQCGIDSLDGRGFEQIPRQK